MKIFTLTNVKLLITVLLITPLLSTAQVGIGTTTPNADAELDITSTTRGLLLPRVALSNTTNSSPLSTDVAGMTVYNTATTGDVTPGFYYNDGALWIRLGGSVSADWSLTGNGSTTPGTNYVGTSDDVDLYISRNGTDQIRLTTTELVINENSDDRDFRIESNNNTALFLMDAGTDRVMVNSLGGAFTLTNFQSSTSNGNIALLGSSFGSGTAGYFHTDATSTATAGVRSYTYNGAIAILADNDAVANGDDTIVARSDSDEGFGAGWFYNINNDDASGLGTAEATYGILSDVADSGEYHIGIYGKSDAGDKNTMGVYGNITTPGGGTFTTNGAGALGYRNGANGGGAAIYGGFFEGDDGGATDGTFKTMSNSTKEQSSVGFAAKGGLMGGWVKGQTYGLATQGKRFSLYVNGRAFTNDVITQLNESNNTNRVATYVPTSTTVDVTSKGVSKLSNGKKRVTFNKEFSQLSSSKEPIIVTVTPLGKSNGVYIESVDANGFTIVENNDGIANVQFTWIAIATRKGYEIIETAEELLANDYDHKLSKFMTGNILNNNDVEGQEMWWDGNRIQYSNTPEPKYNSANSVKAKDSKEKDTPLVKK
ncbi:MAG: hypothetical protein HRT69_03080 [Flavobacteriaceae bacterium]|nr:hypothetical protein [Flavobacteriaceae bacterium]